MDKLNKIKDDAVNALTLKCKRENIREKVEKIKNKKSRSSNYTIKYTSHIWCQVLEIKESDILDPDGWDRSGEDNFHFSFNQEVISQKQFNERICASTCKDSALKYCFEKVEAK